MTGSAPRVGTGLILLLGSLEAFGPLSMDLYMPALPALARSLEVSDALAQMTMSVCMLGLGAGQLIVGPMSDRWGRRTPLLTSVILFTAFSAACAVAPSIGWLLFFRTMQGLCGAAGSVITLAVARDIASGPRLARLLSWLALVGATAPVLAPVLGGQLSRMMDWRGIFWVLAGIGALLLTAALLWLPESYPRARRLRSGTRSVRTDARELLTHRTYRGVVLMAMLSGTAFFAYLSMSTFVLQDGFGITPQAFGVVFALGSLCNVVGSQTNRILVARFTPERLYLVGLALAFTGGSIAALSGALRTDMPLFLAGLAISLTATGFTIPNSRACALTNHGHRAGSAAAILGASSFSVGPIAAPILSAGGASATGLGVTMAVASGGALAIGLRTFRRSPSRQDGDHPADGTTLGPA